MDQTPDVYLVERVERLERENWRLKLGSSVAFTALVSILLVVSAYTFIGPDKLSVEHLAIRDPSGKERVVLVVNREGLPVIGMMDSNGGERLDLSLSEAGTPFVTMRDANLKVRFEARVTEENVPVLTLCGKDEKSRVLLVVRTDDVPVLALVDSEGKERFDLLVNPDGQTVLAVRPRRQGPAHFDDKVRRFANCTTSG